MMAGAHRSVLPLIALMVVLVLMGSLAALPAGAADKKLAPGSESAPAQGHQKSGKQAPGSRSVVLPGGSGESPAARSARLRRECKGRPNAGACTGYTD